MLDIFHRELLSSGSNSGSIYFLNSFSDNLGHFTTENLRVASQFFSNWDWISQGANKLNLNEKKIAEGLRKS